ncbi:NYN domain-containing protein [Marinicella sp. S1101]|uniref:NYN domain-containing protein n=1 Tax=Marinicella marina TaxID=2996016 RepID=UPI002260D444|nr:NYN domain-containing protein [Marinicella marina]MCX7552744.1 NYN domain-containing protein [Marinicella marina]MDJ1139947.1 NYN domain-containing protein [Marinicella marina]
MKIGVFVDVQNIYYTTREAFGRTFDYRKFWQHVSDMGQIEVAKAYAISRNVDDQKKFQSALRHIGFDVILKPMFRRQDGTTKGDWDVGITIDVLEAAAELDRVILLSGDGDFAILLQHIMKKHGIKTQVFGVPKLTSDSLINACTDFTAIDGIWLQNPK